MLETNRQALIVSKPESIRCLYDKYGGMLLGYIFEIVNDRKLAEEYLVRLFCDLSHQIDDMEWNGTNSWCKLQGFARSRLATYRDTVKQGENPSASGMMIPGLRHQYLEQLTDLQKLVFSDVYYHGKSIVKISVELKETENLIRKTLKEAFTIIKKGGGN